MSCRSRLFDVALSICHTYFVHSSYLRSYVRVSMVFLRKVVSDTFHEFLILLIPIQPTK